MSESEQSNAVIGMGDKLGIVRFDGKMTLISPLAQITGSVKRGDGSLLQLQKRIRRQIGNQIMSFPMLSSNTIRSMIRDNMARDISAALERHGLKIGYQELVVLFCGGGGAEGKEVKAAEAADTNSTEKKKDSKSYSLSELILAQIAAKKTNVSLSLLGASALRNIISGKTVIGIPLVICKETVEGGLINMDKIAEEVTDLPEGRDNNFIDVHTFIRKDDIATPDVFSMLSPEGVSDMIAFEGALSDKKAAKKGDAAEGEQKSSETSRQMIFSVETVIPGVKFYHYNILRYAASVELGAFLGALKRFSLHPFIAGLSARGFGNIALSYTISIDGIVHGEVIVDDNGFTLNGASEVVEKAMSDYQTYLDNLTPDDISVELK